MDRWRLILLTKHDRTKASTYERVGHSKGIAGVCLQRLRLLSLQTSGVSRRMASTSLQTVFFAVNVLFSSSCGIFVSYGHVSSEWDRLRMKTRLFSSILLLYIQLYSRFGHAIPINIFKNGCHLDYILFLFGQRSLITSHDFKI